MVGVIESMASAQPIKVGEAELFYTLDEIPIRYDGTIYPLRKKGNVICFLGSFGCRIEPGDSRRSLRWRVGGQPEDP